MADMKASDMLGQAMTYRNAVAKLGALGEDVLSATMQVVQADALISIAYSLDRIAAALGADHA